MKKSCLVQESKVVTTQGTENDLNASKDSKEQLTEEQLLINQKLLESGISDEGLGWLEKRNIYKTINVSLDTAVSEKLQRRRLKASNVKPAKWVDNSFENATHDGRTSKAKSVNKDSECTLSRKSAATSSQKRSNQHIQDNIAEHNSITEKSSCEKLQKDSKINSNSSKCLKKTHYIKVQAEKDSKREFDALTKEKIQGVNPAKKRASQPEIETVEASKKLKMEEKNNGVPSEEEPLLKIELEMDKIKPKEPFKLRDIKSIVSEYEIRNKKWKETFLNYKCPARWGIPVVRNCSEKWDGKQIPPKLLQRYQKYLSSKNLTHSVFFPVKSQNSDFIKFSEISSPSKTCISSVHTSETETNFKKLGESSFIKNDSDTGGLENNLNSTTSVKDSAGQMILRNRTQQKPIIPDDEEISSDESDDWMDKQKLSKKQKTNVKNKKNVEQSNKQLVLKLERCDINREKDGIGNKDASKNNVSFSGNSDMSSKSTCSIGGNLKSGPDPDTMVCPICSLRFKKQHIEWFKIQRTKEVPTIADGSGRLDSRMGVDQERHRPGLLKQQNKAHKHGRHRSKGAVHVAEKGRVAVKIVTKKFKTLTSKDERRNQMIQHRLKKRQEALERKRRLGSFKAPPFLAAVIPLNFSTDTEKLLKLVKNCSDEIDAAISPEGVLHFSIERLKQKFSFMVPQIGNLYAVLDALKVADTVLFVVSAVAEPTIDQVSEGILTAVLAQGLPSVVVAAIDLENIPLKKRSVVKQNIQKLISQWLPEEKIIALDKEADGLNLLRKIGSQKQRSISQRDRRPHLLAEELLFINDEGSSLGVLKVSGYLRGQMLSVNSLIHIPGWGDFQMKQIDGVDFEASVKSGEKSGMKVLEVADPSKQTSLASENIPDPMDAEQTWPTEKELKEAKEERKQKKLVKKIPKGMSDYQACWIPDEEAEELDVDSEGDFEVEKPMSVDSDEDSQKKVKFDDEEQYDTVTETEGDVDAEKYDKDMDMDEEKEAREKIKEAKMDLMFPDEVDTPQDIPARERFQKYRGLASFRTSPWDPKENLPPDYARIFQFENFNRTRKRVFSQLENLNINGVTPGSYITIHIDKMPAELFNARRRHEPVIVFGMLEHEQKMSVVNMVLKRCQNTPWAEIPIRSKEELIFQCGYRRYKGRPIFSEHTNGNKHKYQRYFQPGTMVVATLYAPIIYPPASVLVFKENPNGTQDVIATGTVLSVNPDRLVIKRVVLSGHPFKVNKKSAVIRFMFFNREDINWFKPVELKTKYGRRGHIREPLGTHGHMKTVFDGQLKSQDTVLMFLYKRVFPKWSYDPVVKYTNSRYKNLASIPEENGTEMEQ